MFVTVALCEQAFLEMVGDRVGQKVRGGAFDFIEYAMQVEGDYRAELFSRVRFCATSFIQIRDQAIKGVVLAKEEDFVFAVEVVVEVGGGEVGGGGDFAHAGFGEAAGAEFAAGGAEDFEAAREVAAMEAGGTHRNRIALGDVGVNGK